MFDMGKWPLNAVNPLLFKIKAAQHHLKPGDRVSEETPVGAEWRTGQIVCAGCRGHVERIHFVGADRTLIVEIIPARSFQEGTR